MTYKDYLAHHGIKEMKWGKKNGPPYPLTESQRSADERNANPVSASARMLAKEGDNNRFAKGFHGTSSSSSSKSSKKGDDRYNDERFSRPTRIDYLKKTGKWVVEEKKKAAASSEDEKASKSAANKAAKEAERQRKAAEREAERKRKEEERQRKAAEKEAENKRKAEEKERDNWEKESTKMIDNLFNGNKINRKAFEEMLREFDDGGLFSKDTKGGTFEEDNKNFEGSSFYKKMLSKLDPKSKEYQQLKEAYEDISKEASESKGRSEQESKSTVLVTDSETGKKVRRTYDPNTGETLSEDSDTKSSLSRLSKSVSLFADYATAKMRENPTDNNKVQAKVLNYLEDKLTWFAERGTSSSSGKANAREKFVYEEIEDWLRKLGF